MRDGEKVTVRALCAMPGVADGAVLHDVEWGPRLATLVGTGRFEVLDGGRQEPAAAAAADVDLAGTAAAGGEDAEPPRPRQARAR